MLYVCTTLQSNYTFVSLSWFFGKKLRKKFKLIPYERLWLMDHLPRGTYIFSDLERLTTDQQKQAAQYADALIAENCPVLNHPAHIEKRFNLLKRLHTEGTNTWNVHNLDTPMEQWNFPVFIRSRNLHNGALSDLLQNPAEADTYQKTIPPEQKHNLMVCEYKEYREASSNHFIKYSVQRIGDTYIYGHRLENTHWVVKIVTTSTPEMANKDEQFIREKPQLEKIKTIFKQAHIDYGRIDYALGEKGIEVFEINTAPHIGIHTSPLKIIYPSRKKKAAHIVQTLLDLSKQPIPGTKNIPCPFTPNAPYHKRLHIDIKSNIRLLRNYLHCQKNRLTFFIKYTFKKQPD